MLNNQDARKILQSTRVGRLGCIVNGEPYIVPISYNFEDGYLYGHSLPGTKIKALRENPRACLQADQIESDLHWQSALAFGKFEEMTKTARAFGNSQQTSEPFPNADASRSCHYQRRARQR